MSDVLKNYVAGADLTGKLYYAVKMDGNADTDKGLAKIVLAGAGEKADGILYQDGAKAFADGDVVGVKDCGQAFAIAGGTINEGDELAVGTGAKLVKATTGNYVVAIAQEAGASGERIKVELTLYKV